MRQTLRQPPSPLNRLSAALSLALGLAAAPAAQAGIYDMYWVGQAGSSSSFSSEQNWWTSYTRPANTVLLGWAPSSQPWLLHLGKGKYTQLNVDASLYSVGLRFDGDLALTLGGTAYLNLTQGIVNSSGKQQSLTLGLTVSGDQIWDGGTGGLYASGGMDLFAQDLNLSRKVTLDYDALVVGNHSGGNGQTTLTVAGASQVLLKGAATVGNDASPGTVFVQGSGSLLRVGTELVVGNTSDGALQVLAGGTASAANLFMGRVAGTSIVNVSGAGSSLALSGNITASQGDLSVGAGGQVTFQDAQLADFALGTVSVNVAGTGASFTSRGTLNLGAGGAATLNVQTGGRVSADQLNIGSGGTLNLVGGTVVANYASNLGTINWSSGTVELLEADTSATSFLGRARSLAAGSSLVVGGALYVLDDTSLSLVGGQASAFQLLVKGRGEVNVGSGSTLTLAGMTNDGTVTLAGGTLSGGIVNNGALVGAGVIAGTGGFVNNGVVSQTGALTLRNTGVLTANVNNGSWDIASGRGLALDGATLTNAGTLNIGGDTVSGSGRLVNAAGGTVAGYGAITAAFSNAGRLVVDGGVMRIGQAFSNVGTVLLNSALATLSGATLTNTGRIEGQGQINNDVANGGTLLARGGTLSLGGAVSNSGTLAVNRDATLLVAQGLGSNAGKIQLAGGTFDNNGNALTNGASGVISGYGDVRASTLTNQGRVLMSGGTSAVYADVLGSNASQIILSGNSNTSFYGKVDIQSGAELRVSLGSVATFFEAVQQRSGARFTGNGGKRYEGGLTVGASPGLGTDEGDVEFGEGNTYLAEIGGTTACTLVCGSNDAVKNTSFDKYAVLGQLSFGGTLTLTSWNGFVGQAGQHFDLFDWGSTTGSFASIDSSGFKLAAGTRLDTSALYTTGEISITAVPEPAHWALLLAGLAGLGWKSRRRASGHPPA